MTTDPLELPAGNGFALVKLYVDCVAPDGTAAIAYAGRLAWHGVALALSGVSIFDPDGATAEGWALGAGAAVGDARSLTWQNGASSVAVESVTPGFASQLYAGSEGAIAFDGLAPAGRVRIVGNDRVVAGDGYAERLTLTIPPWAMPIDSLRWGRLATPERSVVWIEWRGPHPLTRVFVDGRIDPAAAIEGDRIVLADAVLHLDPPRVLRSGPLGRFGGGFAQWVRSLPGVSAIHETKRLRRATLEQAGTSVAAAWVIDEDVALR